MPLDILNPLQMLDLFYKRMRLVFQGNKPDLNLQMRASLPKHPPSSLPTKPETSSNDAIFAQDMFGMFLEKLPLELV